ncbi:ARM repeat-containing protein [Xylariaceae sp. FL0255]|nr:ARM repeat-containing protein [Xylariaceae sp. FL0255]
MTTGTRSNGFPTLATGAANGNKPSQSLSSQSLNTFANSTWQPNNIWGNGIGNSINTNRDTAGSRGSDELSPTAAPSTSNPLNQFPTSKGWGTNFASNNGSRGIWEDIKSNTNNVSPTQRTKDSFPYSSHDNNNGPPLFAPMRPSVTTGLSNRTTPSVSAENPTSATRYNSMVGGGFGSEDTGGSSVYNPLGLDSASALRRNSTDPGILPPTHTRPSTFANRQTENRLRFGDNSSHSFGTAAGYGMPRTTPRPSVSGPSVTLPSERSQLFSFPGNESPSDLSEALVNRALTLDDSNDSNSNGVYSRSGFLNPASQPFQFNPSSQSWQQQHDFSSNGARPFGSQSVQPDWSDPGYQSVKRGSIVDRGSPAGSVYRSHVGSPRRFSATPNARMDPWNAPSSRHQSMSQDIDRQQPGNPYSHQQSGYFNHSPAPYYHSNGMQYNPYDQYAHTPSFHHQIPNGGGYGLPLGYVPIPPIQRNQPQDNKQVHRSQLLIEFLANSKTNARRFELKDIYNHITEFSGDQNGSRFVQEKLTTANSEEKEQVFREIEPNLVQLMMDLFGNYVIQKFFEHGNQIQKKIMAASMKGKICELSLQTYACRVVQKALEHVLVEQQAEFVEELKPTILHIAKHSNGNHVIQKIVEVAPRLCVQSLLDAMKGQVEALASQNFACRVIQRMLEKGTDQEKQVLMDELHTCARRLIPDQYGNYVTQHIILHGNPEDRRKIIEEVIKKVVHLSQHKYASNVVEKCIQYGTSEQKDRIYAALTIHDVKDNRSMVETLLKDQYGNYVIQKLINSLDEPRLEAFYDKYESSFETWMKNGKPGLVDKAIASFRRPASRSADAKIAVSGNSTVNGNVTTNGTTSAGSGTPNLLVEVGQSAPTPPLVTEQNSPQSSSSPSTNLSATYEVLEEQKVIPVTSLDEDSSSVHVQED